MAYVYPLAFNAFMDQLGIEKITWDIKEFKEYDTQGTGHDLEAELAPSKWVAQMVMRELYNDAARKIAAISRKVGGKPVMVYDPSNPYPFADPRGTIINAWATPVQIASIGANGQSLSLKGMPNNYALTAGDKGQVIFASGARNYFFEFSETASSGGAGTTGVIEVFPPLPVGVNVDATVILAKPACKMRIGAGGFAPGQSSGNMTFGTTLDMIERI